MRKIIKEGQLTHLITDEPTSRPSRIQQNIEAKKSREGVAYMASFMVGVTKARFAQMGIQEGCYPPVAFVVDTRTFEDPLLRRIAANLGSAPALNYLTHGQSEWLIYEEPSGQVVVYDKWDVLGDDERAEAYLKRHYAQMDIAKIILIPTEPTYMQASVAVDWANKIGYPVSLEGVEEYLAKYPYREYAGMPHVCTNHFYGYLQQLPKARFFRE